MKCDCTNPATHMMKHGLQPIKPVCYDCKNYWEAITDNKPEKPEFTTIKEN